MKSIFSILIAGIFLVMSTGFTLNHHYCKGDLVKTELGLVSKDISCCDNEENMPEGCCDNKTEHLQLDEDYQATSYDFQSHQDFFVAFVISYVKTLFENTSFSSEYLNYKPPLLDRDIPVFIQSFLI